jgi:hypothetical protein
VAIYTAVIYTMKNLREANNSSSNESLERITGGKISRIMFAIAALVVFMTAPSCGQDIQTEIRDAQKRIMNMPIKLKGKNTDRQLECYRKIFRFQASNSFSVDRPFKKMEPGALGKECNVNNFNGEFTSFEDLVEGRRALFASLGIPGDVENWKAVPTQNGVKVRMRTDIADGQDYNNPTFPELHRMLEVPGIDKVIANPDYYRKQIKRIAKLEERRSQ